ncbi:allophanate hydrolase subunit 1 [Deinococcus taeanensis]|uniref:5-oxoprolinase subunit B family protein n=1 Tax=Deinococcus taeanensis TaxID=2737050 RepID=UPI001CDBCD16|nr:allophanate hydrolase subunit 1 [Deinococcus taeanensis]UBV43016.1 allophanate hydrolase subunit 1 [Deinococcus taeanensis]
MSLPVLFTPLGDAAVRVVTPLARELQAALEARPLPGVREVVPALGQLTLLLDPLVVRPDLLEGAVRERLAVLSAQPAASGRTVVVPVTFDGPDLTWCAAHAGLSPAGLVGALCAAPLEVAFLGFTPGFAFLTGLPAALQMPRLDAPRERVPAGSVALGGPWAGVYPRATPGGWRLVGRTTMNFFDLSRAEPVPWRAGDWVRFEVSRD